MDNETEISPKPGETFTDVDGRVFLVDMVDPGSLLGGQVSGRITDNTNLKPRPYSCSLLIWKDVWHDKAERWGR